jgi:1-acyl-sn-glycerol-3-phosphate acyltransferase
MSRFSNRKPSEYNAFRSFFQWLVTSVGYATIYKIKCGYEVIGREHLPKNDFYIIASNHVSAIDPFLVCNASNKSVAYMAKEELFEKFWSRVYMDFLGSFAVKRGKLQVSTIKTAMGIKETKWALAMFPQGTRKPDGDLSEINRGFAVLAKKLQCPVVPMGIIGAEKNERNFGGKITIKIGEPIPYNENTDEMVDIWVKKIVELTGKNDE